ncbi:MAG: phosphate regulon sensor histidine kinase PhoR [Cellvibrionales bacterium]|nr:phosphate regulon sensor histidine kinase PhoR [Cellvibrionales bacterium]
MGAILGEALTGALAGFALYAGFKLWQTWRLSRWLEPGKKGGLPAALPGIFGRFIEQAEKQKRTHKRGTKKLKAALRRQRELMEGVRDAVILVDPQGGIQWFNRAARRLFDLKPKRARGTPVAQLLPDLEFIAYLDKGQFAEPLAFAHPASPDRWLEARVTEYQNAERIILLRDLTRLRRLENSRRDFVANLSHELRTPLTVLRGYLETLRLHRQSDPALRDAFDQMEVQSIRMARLLQDLTTLAQLESPEPARCLQPVEVTGLLRRIVADARQLNEYRDHRLETQFAGPVCLHAIESELYSAFSNLIFNAVRHTPGGTAIQIRCDRSKAGLRVRVEDAGPGIAAKHLPRLTERFYRVDDSRSSATGGTGLGLAIVKHAMAGQRGRLQIKSQLGAGSTFSCLFPAEQIVEADCCVLPPADAKPLVGPDSVDSPASQSEPSPACN